MNSIPENTKTVWYPHFQIGKIVRYKRAIYGYIFRNYARSLTGHTPSQPIVTPLILSIPRHIQFEF